MEHSAASSAPLPTNLSHESCSDMEDHRVGPVSHGSSENPALQGCRPSSLSSQPPAVLPALLTSPLLGSALRTTGKMLPPLGGELGTHLTRPPSLGNPKLDPPKGSGPELKELSLLRAGQVVSRASAPPHAEADHLQRRSAEAQRIWACERWALAVTGSGKVWLGVSRV